VYQLWRHVSRHLSDLDLEAGDPSHFGAFLNALNNYFKTDSSKQCFISYGTSALLDFGWTIWRGILTLHFWCCRCFFYTGLLHSAPSPMNLMVQTTQEALLILGWWTIFGFRYPMASQPPPLGIS